MLSKALLQQSAGIELHYFYLKFSMVRIMQDKKRYILVDLSYTLQTDYKLYERKISYIKILLRQYNEELMWRKCIQ